jgi:integrase
VDKRSVINPTQARVLRAQRPSGPRLSLLRRLALRGLRPEEAIALRRQDVKLPELLLDEERHGWVEAGSAWGELHLRAAMPDVGRQWTDDGSSRDSRGLKQRAEGETRRVPCPPALVDLLREHLAGADGESGQLIFRGIQGCPLPTITYRRSWDRAWARNAVFSVQDYQSPLAHRPYDLRHARLSTWLNSGVAAAQVAEWAGHSVEVLLRVYAKCLEGQDDIAKRRISEAIAAD